MTEGEREVVTQSIAMTGTHDGGRTFMGEQLGAHRQELKKSLDASALRLANDRVAAEADVQRAWGRVSHCIEQVAELRNSFVQKQGKEDYEVGADWKKVKESVFDHHLSGVGKAMHASKRHADSSEEQEVHWLAERFTQDLTDAALAVASFGANSQPLFVFLDGVHLLAADAELPELSWIPELLPPSVKLVLGVTEDALPFEIGNGAKYRDAAHMLEHFVEQVIMPTVAPDTRQFMVESWINARKGHLTELETSFVLEVWERTGSVLAAHVTTTVAADPLWKWSAELVPPATLKEAVELLFGLLDMRFGAMTVGYTSLFMAASSVGLSWAELQALHPALDKAMWAHVRLEELLVYLRPYITPTDGKPTVNCFRHRELFNTVSTTPAA